jgi:hypothetical protein
MPPEARTAVGASPLAQISERLGQWSGKRGDPTGLILVSLAAVVVDSQAQAFIEACQTAVKALTVDRGDLVAELPNHDFVMLVHINESSLPGLISRLKMRLLRAIGEHHPTALSSLNQTRLVRAFELRSGIQTAQDVLKRLNVGETRAPATKALPMRRLTAQDLEIVKAQCLKQGPQKFAEQFVQRQGVALLLPDMAPRLVMQELFFAMDRLRKDVMGGVDLRGGTYLLQHLTLFLDSVLLQAFEQVRAGETRCSINLNLETTFTPIFERFLDSLPEELLRNMVFEFRQENILLNHSQYVLTRDMIRERGSHVCVDAVFTDTLGVVNLAFLKPDIVKVFWGQNGHTYLHDHAGPIGQLLDAGTYVILARVDQPEALESGHSVGINMFQGFLIDRMLGRPGA